MSSTGPLDDAPPRPVPPVLDLPANDEGFEHLRAIIRTTWGFDDLKPLQARAMRAALDGRDLLLVLPTGGGKSLCYQAPALARGGLTVVVSPLISLMKDQVDGLVQNGVPAAMLTSAQDSADLRHVHDALDRGLLSLLFVAPERLAAPGFVRRLADLSVSAVAVDEAHCISHWGHDFRPEYRQLGELRAHLPGVPMHAFTATATEAVRVDIVRELRLSDPAVLIGPCDRPNLTYRCRPRADLLGQVLAVVERHPGQAGIVYCIARKDTESLAADLASKGVRAAAYHAGLAPERRRTVQERFQSEELDIVVATIAFGMGIDRPDVRFVTHAALPKGLEQYSQETGRAGRDGLPSECLLLFTGSDFHTWKNLLERGTAEGEGSDAALEAGLQRLSRVFRFASGGICRHKSLVEHFGQTYEPPPGADGCGACDVCLGELTAVPDAQVIAQKILSCVVRCEQRFGATHVTDVLRGGDTARVRQTGHSQLSTFGLMKQHSAREIRGWIDQLVGLDHLRTTPGRYPTLHLSPTGVEVMRAERSASLFVQPGPARSRARPAARLAAEAPTDDALYEPLFERLRALRRTLASERGVPPYLIFGDRTLTELAARRPGTQAELLDVKGIGEVKARDLGPAFLSEIAGFLAEQAAPG